MNSFLEVTQIQRDPHNGSILGPLLKGMNKGYKGDLGSHSKETRWLTSKLLIWYVFYYVDQKGITFF